MTTPLSVEFGHGVKAIAQKKRYSDAEKVVYTFSQGDKKREVKKFDLMKMLSHLSAKEAQVTYFGEGDIERK